MSFACSLKCTGMRQLGRTNLAGDNLMGQICRQANSLVSQFGRKINNNNNNNINNNKTSFYPAQENSYIKDVIASEQ